MTSKLGQLIQEIRTPDYSTREFASLLGVMPATVNRWEKGIHNPRPANIRKLKEIAPNRIEAIDRAIEADRANHKEEP